MENENKTNLTFYTPVIKSPKNELKKYNQDFYIPNGNLDNNYLNISNSNLNNNSEINLSLNENNNNYFSETDDLIENNTTTNNDFTKELKKMKKGFYLVLIVQNKKMIK